MKVAGESLELPKQDLKLLARRREQLQAEAKEKAFWRNLVLSMKRSTPDA